MWGTTIDTGAAIAAVRVMTDIIKRSWPTLTTRGVQAVVLGLSIGGGFLVSGVTDVALLLKVIGAIFAGAMCFYEVVSKHE
jgi:hypothetical protein